MSDARVIRLETYVEPGHVQAHCIFVELEGESVRYFVSGTNVLTGEVFLGEDYVLPEFAVEEWVKLTGCHGLTVLECCTEGLKLVNAREEA